MLQRPDSVAIGKSSAVEPPASLTADPAQPPATVSFDGSVFLPNPVPLSHFTPSPAALLPKWRSFSLHPHLLQVLHKNSFTSPTPIQSQALPFALSGRDVIGVAETVCRIHSSAATAYNAVTHRGQAKPSRTGYPFFIAYSHNRGILPKNALSKP